MTCYRLCIIVLHFAVRSCLLSETTRGCAKKYVRDHIAQKLYLRGLLHLETSQRTQSGIAFAVAQLIITHRPMGALMPTTLSRHQQRQPWRSPRRGAASHDVEKHVATHTIPLGSTVTIAGLKAKPELNGRAGLIVSNGGDRLGVEIEGHPSSFALRRDNLTPVSWRAPPDEQRQAAAAVAEALADASLDDEFTPRGVAPAEVRQAEATARERAKVLCQAHAHPVGREVALEGGQLDAADCLLDGAAAHTRIFRRIKYKELAFILWRKGPTHNLLEGHKCACVAARHSDAWRELFARWAYALIDGDQRALGDAVAAVAQQKGIFDHPDQRPASLYARGLRLPSGARGPWYDPREIRAATILLSQYADIHREFAQLAGGSGSAAGGGSAFERYPSPAVARGEWSDFMLVHGGKRHAPHCARCPSLARLLTDPSSPLRAEAAAMVLGSCFFSRMRPGTHLRAHCGPTNLRLRVHIGVDVPGESGRWRLRVGDEVREWANGEALVFDDSYEHEVWHEPAEGVVDASGGRSRVVLIVDIWHPALSPQRRMQMLGGHDEAKRYQAIMGSTEPLEAMGTRELSDGSVRLVRGD